MSNLPGIGRIDHVVKIIVFSHDGTDAIKFAREFVYLWSGSSKLGEQEC